MNPIIHNRNLIKDSIFVEEKAEAYQLKKAGRLKENDTRIKAVRAKYVRDLRASRAAKDAEVRVAPTDGVFVVEDLPEIPKGDKVTPKNIQLSYEDKEFGLSYDQYTILKHDLHYSHSA